MPSFETPDLRFGADSFRDEPTRSPTTCCQRVLGDLSFTDQGHLKAMMMSDRADDPALGGG